MTVKKAVVPVGLNSGRNQKPRTRSDLLPCSGVRGFSRTDLPTEPDRFDCTSQPIRTQCSTTTAISIVNDKDLQSCLRYFHANLLRPNICSIYLDEKLEKLEESFQVSTHVRPSIASATKKLAESVVNLSQVRDRSSFLA